MAPFSEDDIANAYAHYGVQLQGVEAAENTPRIEDIILAVLETPPPGRFVSMLPTLILKNHEKIDFNYIKSKTNAQTSSKLGYILDVSISCSQEIRKLRDQQELQQTLRSAISNLAPSPLPIVWVPEKLKIFYRPEDFTPQEPHEKKWCISTKYDLETFIRHAREYIRDA